MGFPKGYEWLGTVGALPRTIQEGLKLLGTVETRGPASNPAIMAWAKEVGLASTYSDDAVPWCGLYSAIVAKRAGKNIPGGPLWARNWLKFGSAPRDAGLGDVLIFQRPGGGGHVGFYVAEDATAYHVLGGNQSDAVTITHIAKSRCIGARRPSYNAQPASVKAYRVAAGGALSTNEA